MIEFFSYFMFFFSTPMKQQTKNDTDFTTTPHQLFSPHFFYGTLSLTHSFYSPRGLVRIGLDPTRFFLHGNLDHYYPTQLNIWCDTILVDVEYYIFVDFYNITNACPSPNSRTISFFFWNGTSTIILSAWGRSISFQFSIRKLEPFTGITSTKPRRWWSRSWLDWLNGLNWIGFGMPRRTSWLDWWWFFFSFWVDGKTTTPNETTSSNRTSRYWGTFSPSNFDVRLGTFSLHGGPVLWEGLGEKVRWTV